MKNIAAGVKNAAHIQRWVRLRPVEVGTQFSVQPPTSHKFDIALWQEEPAKYRVVIKTKWFSGIGVCSATAFQYWFQFQQINLCRRRRVSAVTGVRDSRQKASYGLIWRLIPSFTTQYAAAKKKLKLSVKMSFPRNLSPSHPVKYWLIFFRSSEGGCGA